MNLWSVGCEARTAGRIGTPRGMVRHVFERLLDIRLTDVTLPATLAEPGDARGLVVFAHGAGVLHRSGNRQVRGMNERACLRLGATRRLEIIPGTSYGLDEPEALEDICRLATNWFLDHCKEEELETDHA